MLSEVDTIPRNMFIELFDTLGFATSFRGAR